MVRSILSTLQRKIHQKQPKRFSSKMFLCNSLESDGFESIVVAEDDVPKSVRLNEFFKTGPSKVSGIIKILAKRIKIRGDAVDSRSKTFNTMAAPRTTSTHGSSFTDSPSWNSDAKTEVRNNLSSQHVRTEVLPVDGGPAETKICRSIASTFVGKEETLVEDEDVCTINSPCEDDDSKEASKMEMKPKVLIMTAQCDEKVELLYSNASMMTDFDTSAGLSSQADSSLSLSPHSPFVSVPWSSKEGSIYSNSSQGILYPPKLAIGGHDMFSNSDFSIVGAARPLRRVHFSNMDKLNDTSASNSLLRTQTSSTLSSVYSDGSSTSFEYLMNWCA